MKKLISSLIISSVALLAGPALAETQTVTLDVENMTCALCPLTVKRSLTAVEGVSGVEVSFDDKTAVVTYDDAQTDLAALTRATTNAGYPSHPRETAQ